jgi:ADP-heptose:LPS heptosyltransferase
VRIDGIVMALDMAGDKTRDPDTRCIVALRALGLGDLLTGIPALRGLRRRFPKARLLLAAPRQYRELALLSGAVDDVVDTPGLGPILGAPQPDLAVNLHGRGPQSIAALAALHPARLLTHHHDDHPDLAGPPWRADLHETDRWCALLHWAGINCRADDLRIDRPEGYADNTGVIVIHPGAGAPARQWPVHRFAAVASALAADGHRVVVTGSAAEAELVAEVVAEAGLPPDTIWPTETGLLGLVALIAYCRLLVCGDTGVGHIATATGTPSVLLFGPTPPKWWGPRGDGRQVALWAGDCGDPHAQRPDPGLLLLSVPRVLDAARDALASCR